MFLFYIYVYHLDVLAECHPFFAPVTWRKKTILKTEEARFEHDVLVDPATNVRAVSLACDASATIPLSPTMSDSASSPSSSTPETTPPTTVPPSPSVEKLSLRDITEEDKKEAARLKAEAGVAFKSACPSPLRSDYIS
jgi:hypothetical protein